ncbi:MAG TPA: hypothetical protein DCM27_06885 [Rhodospirillaceae bacterium]|nr:hypothetical protein [Rhodospirillaceae bacterium]
MFRIPHATTDNQPKYIYLHKLEHLYDNRPILLAEEVSLPFRRRLFLLKRWRDERISYLYECFRDFDYDSDKILHKLLLHIKRMKRLRQESRLENKDI